MRLMSQAEPRTPGRTRTLAKEAIFRKILLTRCNLAVMGDTILGYFQGIFQNIEY
jgi:hypothetical protein